MFIFNRVKINKHCVRYVSDQHTELSTKMAKIEERVLINSDNYTTISSKRSRIRRRSTSTRIR